MTELYAALQPVLEEHEGEQSQQHQEQEEQEEGKERAVQLAIMGRPNGVSALLVTNYFSILSCFNSPLSYALRHACNECKA